MKQDRGRVRWLGRYGAAVLALTVLMLLLRAGRLAEPPLAPELAQPALAQTKVDVVVFGATPEGVTAAVAAARNGLRVLVIEPSGRVGGTMVSAGLNSIDISRGPDGRLLNGGLFTQWYAQVEGDSFDVATAEALFRRMMAEQPLITLWQSTEVRTPKVVDRRIVSVDVSRAGQLERVAAESFIDATEDAAIAAAAGVPFHLGRTDYGGPPTGQAATLVFRITGVNWARAVAYLKRDGDPGSDATARSLWGYGTAMAGYRPVNDRVGVRALNGGLQNDGSVLLNALWVFGTDPLSDATKQEGMRIAQAEIPHLVAYIRAHCPGFEDAEWQGVADRLYIRESRHLADAYYTLTIDDVLENHDQSDAIAYGSYPVDIQASRPGESFTIVGSPRRYAVPLRSLISRSIENLLIASRCAGYSSLAHGSARTIPVGMAVGEAAGTAVAVAHEQKLTAAQLLPGTVGAVQARLVAQGVQIAPFVESSPLAGHPFAEDVRFFRRRGLVAGGYDNDYRLDSVVSPPELRAFLHQVARAFQRSVRDVGGENSGGTITVQEAMRLIGEAGGIGASGPQGSLPSELTPSGALTQGAMYHIVRSLWFVQ